MEGLSLLNFCELGHPNVHTSNTALDHAELSIYYGKGSQGTDDSADITKSIVHCKFYEPFPGTNITNICRC